MYSKFTLAEKYLLYYLTASNGKGHGIHSPFIFRFVQQVLNDRKEYYGYEEIEALRDRMKVDDTVITVDDLGAGSGSTKKKNRRISQIARTALKSPKYAQLLFRMVNFYQPQYILELGTSLGITTAYMATANPSAQITTIEGSEAIAHKAIENFSRLNLQHIRVVTGNFDREIKPVIHSMPKVDLAFVDGNHRREPTIHYFEEIISRCRPDSIIVFDDIHWSEEMEEAWAFIKQHPVVTCTVDLFFLGLVFLKDEFKSKQHFCIRF
ncbi:MAG TPA: class I SAM-dependent methyltransferase [Chitinophagaceae bacterium]